MASSVQAAPAAEQDVFAKYADTLCNDRVVSIPVASCQA